MQKHQNVQTLSNRYQKFKSF